MEHLGRDVIEAEIAELSREIETKRRALEAATGIVDENRLVREAITERVYEQPPVNTSPASIPPATSYLDALEPAAVTKVNDLIAMIPTKGFKQAIAAARREDPHILDAFHDALVDKLYGELRRLKVVS